MKKGALDYAGYGLAGLVLALLIYALLYLGRCQGGLDKNAEATATLERGLAIHDANPTAPAVAAEIRFALARVLAKRKPQRKRAFELARQARATFREAGAQMDKLRTEVDAWLREQGAE